MEQTEERLYQLSRGLVEELGYTLVDVDEVIEHGRRVLRFYIDREARVTLGDCQTVSRELALMLDAEPEFDSGYVLEVSSPGLDHKLRKEREYDHFTGRQARLVLSRPVDGLNVVTGVIVAAASGVVRIATEDGGEVAIPLENITRARLVI